MLDAHLRPGEERLLAVGRGGGRQDRDARPATAGRREQPAIELGHGGEELSGADERHGSGHRPQHTAVGPIAAASTAGASGRSPPPAATLGRATDRPVTRQRWTMVAAILGSSIVFLDGTIVNVALPSDRRGAAGARSSRVLEGQTYVVSGYLAVLAALLILAGALGDYYGRRRIFAIGLTGFGITSVAVRPRPDARAARRRPAPPGRGRRAARARVARDPHGAVRGPGARPARSASGRRRRRRTTLLGPVVGGLLVDGVSWRAAFLINVPLVAIALYATHPPHARDARPRAPRASSTGSAPRSSRSPSAGWRSGRSAARTRNWQDPLAWVALAIGVVALIAFPFLMARRPNPLVPLGLFRRRRFATINLSTLLIYGALYIDRSTSRACSCRASSATRRPRPGSSALPTGIMLTLLSARIGTLGRPPSARAGSSSSGR